MPSSLSPIMPANALRVTEGFDLSNATIFSWVVCFFSMFVQIESGGWE
jgi:hypothetical protein